MKFIYILLSAILISADVLSQPFAPVGAKWTYTERFVYFENTEEIHYSELTVTKDTLIQGRECRDISGARFCWFPEGLQYINSSNDSVFIYDPLLNTFKLIYAFNTPKGGIWDIPIIGWDGFMDTMTVTVDSVSTIQVNSHQLRVQYVTYFGKDYDENGLKDSQSYNSTIVDVLGDLHFIFLFPVEMSSVCDFNYSEGLRCYEDNELGHYESGIAPSCTYTNVGLNEPKIGTLGLHPNPTYSKVYLETVPENLKSIELIDNLGRVVRRFSIVNEIDLEGLPTGIYYLRLRNVEGEFYIEKVVKFNR